MDAYDIAKLLANQDPAQPVRMEYATVTEISGDGALRGVKDGDVEAVPLVRCCHPTVGSRVVLLKRDTEWLAVAVIGGDALKSRVDALESAWDSVSQDGDRVVAQGTSGVWFYRKWASGAAECWNAWSFSVTSVSGWGTLYRSANALVPGDWPFAFVSLPYVWHCLDGNGNGDYQMGAYTAQANFQTTTAAPNIWVITPNSGTYNRGGYVVIYARGRWK